jgi:hypothetical protein
MRLAVMLLALAACGRVNFDPVDDGGGGTGPGGDGNGGGGDGTGGAACLMTNNPQCPESAASLVASGTHMSSGNTEVAGDGQAGTCGGTSSGERATQFLVMSTATFVFTTSGSNFDTVLYAKDTCTGVELACNDDEDPTTKTSRLSLALTAGQRVIIVVDGENNDCGQYVLRAGTSL